MGRPRERKRWEDLNHTTGEIINSIADQLAALNDRDYYEAEPKNYFNLFPFTPWEKQVEILESVIRNKITLVRSSNDMGKTHLLGQLVNFWLDVYRPRGRDTKTKVITTAQTFDHTKFMLWTRIREMYRHVAHRFGNAKMNLTDFTPDPDQFPEWFALGLNPKIDGEEAVSFQGHHGQHVLFIIDEAILAHRAIFKAIEGSLLDYGSRALFVYNPTTTIGSEVYQMEKDIHLYENKSGPDYEKYMNLIVMNCESLFASPEWQAHPELFRELVNPDARDRLIEKYGRKHPVVKARLFAEWPEQDEDAAINNQGLALAFSRYRDDLNEVGLIRRIVYGWDVAGEGSDTNVLYRGIMGDEANNYAQNKDEIEDRDIIKVERVRQWSASHQKSLIEVYQAILEDYHEAIRYNKDFMDEHELKIDNEIGVTLSVDSIGEGSHIPSMLEDLDEDGLIDVISFKAGEKSNGIEEREEVNLLNKISECWYRANLTFSELIEHYPLIILEPNNELEHELKDRKYSYQKKGKEPLVYFIEPKDEYKKRNRNRSPDHADAFLMMLFGYFHEKVNIPRIETVG